MPPAPPRPAPRPARTLHTSHRPERGTCSVVRAPPAASPRGGGAAMLDRIPHYVRAAGPAPHTCAQSRCLRAQSSIARGGGGADMLDRIPHYVPISAKDEWNLDGMLETM